jgi:PAS domain S-box-containing protein
LQTGAPTPRNDDPPPSDAATRLREFRARTLGFLLRASFVVGLAGMAALTPVLREVARRGLAVGWAGVGCFAAAAWLPRLPHRVRAWALAAPALLALVVTLPGGVGPVSLVTAAFAVVLLTLLDGAGSGAASAALVIGSLAAAGLLPEAWMARLSAGAPPSVSRPLLAALGLLPTLTIAIAAITLVVRGLERGFAESLGLLRAAQGSDRRFRGIFDASPDAVAVLAIPGGLFVDVNAGFERLFRWTRAEIAGRRVHDLGMLRAEDRDQLGLRLAEGRDVDGMELTVRRHGGELLHVQLGARIAEIEGQRVIVAVARDVTAERRLQAALRHAQRVEVMGQLAGGIAHNFRTALGAVLAALDYCLDDPPPALGQPLRDARSAAARAVDLATRLTRMARHDPSPRREPVELRALLGELASLCRSTFGARIAVEEDLAADGAVLADRSELYDAFLNVCLNARDALAGVESPRLRLAVHRAEDGRALVATVADNGCGMAPETLERLGEPFFTTKGEGHGTGLGLSTVHAAVRDAGGRIVVESAPGAGTTLHVELPLYDGTAADTPAPVAARAGGRALVVDRDRPALDTVTRQLAALGLEVEPFQDPLAAADRLRVAAGRFDLLVTSVEAGAAGHALVAALRRAAPGVPVLVLGPSAANVPGAAAALAKPASSRELAAAVAGCLRLAR